MKRTRKKVPQKRKIVRKRMILEGWILTPTKGYMAIERSTMYVLQRTNAIEQHTLYTTATCLYYLKKQYR